MEVVAEGVETVDQLDQLRQLGCELGQGYLFSRPVPADKAIKLANGDDILPLSGNKTIPEHLRLVSNS
jgi:EAL domain-containing protein (putative c-di-GMP-specific phosphodiesterase class I)